MNRKLHNTVTALFATSGLLALSLMAANPLAPAATLPGMPNVAQLVQGEAASRLDTAAARSDRKARAEAAAAELAGLDAEATALVAVTTALKAEAAKTKVDRARSHRGRQSVAMPFFSFFPKG